MGISTSLLPNTPAFALLLAKMSGILIDGSGFPLPWGTHVLSTSWHGLGDGLVD